MPKPVDKWFDGIFVAGETVSTKLIQFRMRIFLFFFSMPDWRLLDYRCFVWKAIYFDCFEQQKTVSIGLNYRQTVIKIHSKICHFSQFIIHFCLRLMNEVQDGDLSHLLDFMMESGRISEDKRCEQSLEICSRGERQKALQRLYNNNCTNTTTLYHSFNIERCKRWILIFFIATISTKHSHFMWLTMRFRIKIISNERKNHHFSRTIGQQSATTISKSYCMLIIRFSWQFVVIFLKR